MLQLVCELDSGSVGAPRKWHRYQCRHTARLRILLHGQAAERLWRSRSRSAHALRHRASSLQRHAQQRSRGGTTAEEQHERHKHMMMHILARPLQVRGNVLACSTHLDASTMIAPRVCGERVCNLLKARCVAPHSQTGERPWPRKCDCPPMSSAP